MILIEKPYIETLRDRVRLGARVHLPEKTEEIWFSVEPEYAQYITDDRADAFVVGLLPTAMRLGLDIRCEAPITKRLKYQIAQYVIPTLSGSSGTYHAICLDAPVTEAPLPSAGAVAVCFTGGVDSMYTLMKHMQPRDPAMQLIHLLVANVGSLEGDRTSDTLTLMTERFRSGIAADLGLKVIGLDSNIQQVCPETFLATCEFRLASAALVLQKLLRAVLIGAGVSISQFELDLQTNSFYAACLLPLLETDSTRFPSHGAERNRIQKLDALSDFPPAHRYLHPCIYVNQRKNCGTCGKCLRTLGGLYALGTLDRFEDVFDLADFRNRKEDYLARILVFGNDIFYAEILEALRQKGEVFSPQVRRKARILRAAQTLVSSGRCTKYIADIKKDE